MPVIATREAVTDPKALKNIMLSLQRLMKIGIYYPSGHSTFERAVDFFRQNLARVAGENPYIRFTVKNSVLYLQDIKLDTRYFFVQEFKETLASMAIRHLDIDRDILPGEIQTFIQSLLTYRAKFKSTKAFIRIALEDLPLSVRIVQIEYMSSDGQTESSLDTGNPAQQTLEVFLESLNKQGLTQKQLDQCRHLLESVLLSPGLSLNDKNNSPLITWSDVERLLLSLVEQREDESDRRAASTKSKQNLNALASIFNSLNEQTTEESSIEAIELLVSLVKNSSGGNSLLKESGGKKPSRDDRSEHLNVSEIEHFVERNTTSYIFKKYLVQTNRCEILSIILQLLLKEPPLQVKFRLQQMLREILTGPIQEAEWETIVNGVHQFLQSQDREKLTVSMMMIIGPLRRSEYSSPLYLLEQVSRNCKSIQLDLLLPYIINELLVTGRQEDYEVFEELCNMVLYLQSYKISKSTPVLEQLDALAEQNIAQNLFFSMPAKFYPIFAPLLDTSAGRLLARRAFQAFVNSPTDWLIDALLPILDFTSTLHLKFLYEYLKTGVPGQPTTKVRALAGQMVVEKLPALSEDRRRDLAIVKTISAMPRLKEQNIRQVLEDIASKRYLLVIPDWPPNCRKAAKEALAILNKPARSMD